MCGICGFVLKENGTKASLKKMTDSISFRGPDDEGQEVFFDSTLGGVVGLGHRRLSIVDLKPTGHQPMRSSSGRSWIVFNGEIYNFGELRKVLCDYSFSSTSDTEVLLAGFEKWGFEALLKKIRGMFSFLIYDSKEHLLYFARDRMGEKPFYYYYDGTSFAFGSTLTPIMLTPNVHLSIRKEVIPSYLQKGYIESPNSIFKNAHKLCPGEFGVFDGHSVKTKLYWDVVSEYKKMSKRPIFSKKKAQSILDGLIQQSVKEQLVADVDVGCLLSGGIDSSTIAAIASEKKDNLLTFSIGFAEKQFDESRFSSGVSSFLKTSNTSEVFGEKELMSLVGSIPLYFDEPFADESLLPTMEVSSLAKNDVTVVLSGDGGDELFSGYTNYKNANKYKLLHFLACSIKPLTLLPRFVREHPSFSEKIISYSGSNFWKYPTQLVDNKNLQMLSNMMGEADGKHFLNEEEKNFSVFNKRRSFMLRDMKSYLPDCVMTKVDRSAMKHSLESRSPLLDPRIVQFSFRIPIALEYRRGSGKQILKRVCFARIPQRMVNNNKHGFGVPIAKWLKGPLREELMSYSSERFIQNEGIFSYSGVRSLLTAFFNDDPRVTSRNVWGFYIFQKWYSYYEDFLYQKGK